MRPLNAALHGSGILSYVLIAQLAEPSAALRRLEVVLLVVQSLTHLLAGATQASERLETLQLTSSGFSSRSKASWSNGSKPTLQL
jgi:hypothetical protein